MSGAAPDAARPGAVAPVRAELLRAARADAEAVLGEAGRNAEAVLGTARQRAAAVLDRARREGEAAGRAAGAAELVRARRAARARILTARGDAYARLCREVAARFRALRGSPRYPRVYELLADHARRLLGPRAAVREHPDGGVVATAPGRRVDLGLDALADRAVRRMGPGVERLWAP